MRQAALILRIPRRQAHIRLAFASSVTAVGAMAILEGLVLMALGWDWGYKLVSDPFRQVFVLDFALCHPHAWGVSLLSVFPRDVGQGYQRLVGLHALQASADAVTPSWPVADARTLVALPKGSQAMLGCANGDLYLVDASSKGTAPRRFGRHARGAADALVCSPDGRFLLSLGPQCLCGWDLPGRRLMWQRMDASFTSAVFHPSSRSLICGLGDGTLEQRDALTGDAVQELARFDLPICQLDVAPDGQRIVALCGERTVLLYDVQAGATRWSRQHWRWPVRFSPQGDLLGSFAYVPGRGWLVVLWDAQTGDELASMAGHTKMIHGASFSPDGFLYSWSADRTIRQWDPVLHRQVRSLPVLPARRAW